VISAVVASDSCFVYVLEGDELVLRASKKSAFGSGRSMEAAMGQGITDGG